MTNIGPRMPSEESRILGSPGSRGSMILYHLPIDGPLSPPPAMNRLTMMSTHSRDSTISYSSDSKYPGQLNEHDVQPYEFDPELDGGTFDKEDLEALSAERSRMSLRGIINVVALISLVAGILGLFVIYPITGLDKSGRQGRIVGNRYINGTGQATGF
ncbi:hypothetical protein CPB85DRAFT_1284913 [Mucidula mucida]|nr:hypothetical protein CPB85DRAFT_1284913 [Mucidula mucida]